MKTNQDVFFQTFEQAPVAIIVSDAGDKILFSNELARLWFAQGKELTSVESLYGQPIIDRQHLPVDLFVASGRLPGYRAGG